MPLPDDDVTNRLMARTAYLGISGITPTVDLFPKKVLPSGLHDPDCYDLTRFLTHLVRHTYVGCRRAATEAITRRPDHYGAHELRRWDGGYDWKGRYHAPIWVKVARAILDRGLDFEGYINAGFIRVANAGSPYPNKLLSPAALDQYQQDEQGEAITRRRIHRATMGSQFALECSRANRLFGGTWANAVLSTLRDPSNALRPFFRYWVAAQFDRVQPEYREVLMAYRPKALREYASSVRAYEVAYRDPDSTVVLMEFRPVVEKARQAFAELVEGDQSRWLPTPVGAWPDARQAEAGRP